LPLSGPQPPFCLIENLLASQLLCGDRSRSAPVNRIGHSLVSESRRISHHHDRHIPRRVRTRPTYNGHDRDNLFPPVTMVTDLAAKHDFSGSAEPTVFVTGPLTGRSGIGTLVTPMAGGWRPVNDWTRTGNERPPSPAAPAMAGRAKPGARTTTRIWSHEDEFRDAATDHKRLA
jgi:hypothetical protein